MGALLDGVKALFSGGADMDRQAEQQAKRDREVRQANDIAIARQKQTLQNEQAEDEGTLAKVKRAGRGRRLLFAATGEGGVSGNLGG